MLWRFLAMYPAVASKLQMNARVCLERRFDMVISAKQTTISMLQVISCWRKQEAI
jgi:hypothetical protein